MVYYCAVLVLGTFVLLVLTPEYTCTGIVSAGTDAGVHLIATQLLVERALNAEGVSRYDLGYPTPEALDPRP
eukprot:3175249-Rhodomonas_salina.1